MADENNKSPMEPIEEPDSSESQESDGDSTFAAEDRNREDIE